MSKKVKSILLVILFILCIGFMFAGCNQSKTETYNKYNSTGNENIKIKTFYERPGCNDSYLTKYVNDWIDEYKNDIEIIDIQITGINGNVNPSSVVMIVYKEIGEESK